MKKKIIIGSRGSDLALWQANFIKGELERKVKSLSVDITIIKTKGDKILDVALSKIGDKGLFIKELEVALLEKRVDLAVHSLKDLQTKLPDELMLSCITKRHDVEDVLIARKKKTTILTLPEGAAVGTGSLRRRSQLLHLRPDIKIEELRGNVPGRIQKFLSSKWDAIILARAGVERLGLKEYISSYIPSDLMLPAVGQGALGIEIHKDNKEVHEILSVLHHAETAAAVLAERSLLKELEGGCQIPIGALGRVTSSGLYLDAVVGSIDGSITYRKKMRGSKNSPELLGKKLAKDLVKAGAGKILKEIYAAERAK